MNKYTETFETWNKVASLYQEKFMDLKLYNETYDIICESISKKSASVLEIGCGPGNISKYLLSKRPDFRIYGIDVSSNMIELAKKNNPTAEFNVMDCRDINQLASKYNAVVSGFCLPYLSNEDCGLFIKSISNLLGENGLLYLSFVDGDYSKSGYQHGSSGDRCYFYYHNLNHIKALLAQHSFSEIKTFNIDYPKRNNEIEIHTIVIARRKAI